MTAETTLLRCPLRVSYPETPGWHQCRHAEHFSAGNWVSDRACIACPVRLVTCDNPRPIPIEPPPRTTPATRPSPIEDRSQPSFLRRAANFAAAIAKHVAAGCPRASQETIDARFAVCKSCPYFSGDRCQHVSCGCNVKATREFLNKLAWEDQKCPVGKWGNSDGVLSGDAPAGKTSTRTTNHGEQ